MLTITRRLAQQIKSVFRQALGLSFRKGILPPVRLIGGPEGLRVRCQYGQAAAEYQLAGAHPQQTLDIPFHMLTEIEGNRETPVEIESRQGKITAAWRDGSVPQLMQYDAPVENSETWPPAATEFAENPPALIRALHEAALTTDLGSARYALGCLLLRGRQGELVATDARQALLQSGFTFPWEGDLMVPAIKVFGNRNLPVNEPVFVGHADDWVVLRVGNWTFWQKIETEGRFPDVTSLFREEESAAASCRISEADRQFLIENLSKLPGGEEHNSPVTVDLNGAVAVRGKQADQESCTELVLAGSTRSGETIRFNTDRRYLQRAAQLGLERLYLYDNQSPILASDGRRQYLWGPLDPKSAIEPCEGMVRIESESAESTNSNPSPQPQRSQIATMTKKSANGQAGKPVSRSAKRAATPPAAESDPRTAGSLRIAGELQETLRTAAKRAGDLVRAIKAEKRQAKLLRSTLASLRSLESLDV